MRRLTDRLSAARRNDGGFTLIELLIVIVILGILAAIVVFSVRGITDRGDVAACKSNVKSAQVAAEAYYAQTGKYPTAMAQISEDDPTASPKKLKLLQEAVPSYVITFGATDTVAPTYKTLTSCETSPTS
jgi:general secretion pathway protein G